VTATLEDRPVAPPAPPTVVPPVDPDEPPLVGRTTALAEVALLGVSLATIFGYARLFEDFSFFAPIAMAAILGHLAAVALRRGGVGPLLATISHLCLLPLVLTVLRYRSTSNHLLPTGTTVDALSDDLADAWHIFLDISAPVPAAPGFIAVAMAAAWIVAYTSDSLAFRLDATIEALAPATGLFLFSSILAEHEYRTVSAALFVASVLAFSLAARVARADSTARWLATDATRGTRSLLAAGALLTAIAVVPAVIAGPRLPGGNGNPLVDLDGAGHDGDRVTLSPLVDIRSRLVEQRDLIAFRVEASSPAYWRLTSLDDFDGQIWSSSGSFSTADGRLDSSPDNDPQAARITQRFHIGALAQIWLPAAFEPVSIDSNDTEVDFDANSSSLVVGTGLETSDGLTYDVLSILPHILRDDLTAGTAGLDTEFLERYTRLPASATDIARRYAREATEGVDPDDDFGRARALQDWFRQNFRYSLEVQPGHGTDALASFLDPSGRIGYCEQFAGAYAALARSLGLPARVAVGFTPGEPDPDDPGTFVVRGLNAHAWPEVYFSGPGWVSFEPTPGRGAPGNEAYTGVPAAQAQPDEVSSATSLAPLTTAAPEDSAPTRPQQTLPDLTTPTGGGDDGPDPVHLGLLGLLLVGGIWLVGVPAAGAVRRGRRRTASHGHPDREVADAWTDSLRSLALIDLRPHRAETPQEFARRAAADAGTDAAAHLELATLTTAATYGSSTGASEVNRARRAAALIRDRCRRLAGPWRRLQAAVSPRRQLRDG
jgi:transglutaminase-like putative cysteine protease